MKNSKSIIKWVGSKSKITDTLLNKFPKNINNYHDIFLGGSVLFGLLSNINITGKCYAYDLNEPLIFVYKNIQNNHVLLYDEIQLLIIEYNSCDNNKNNKNNIDKNNKNRKPKNLTEAKSSKESYYYWVRNIYNNLLSKDKLSVYGSSLFIFLNKTCFRGLFRVGPNGFNVSYGNYVNPEIINKNHLYYIHNLIKNVVFECCSFEISLTKVQKGDFVYLDPPYVEENKKSFVNYTINGFGLESHLKLFDMCKNLNTNFMMSNSDVLLVRDNFKNYEIDSILCKRSINSKNPESKAKEVIITNY